MLRHSRYFRAHNIESALELLETVEGERALLAGGTDLMIQLRTDPDHPPLNLIDISFVPELQSMGENESEIILGAGITHSRLVREALLSRFAPVLGVAAASIGSVQIRNRGTIGGNICNASPCADMAPALLAHEAVLEIRSRRATRSVPLERFITAPYQTCMNPEEMVTGFRIKKYTGRVGSAFLKLGRRNAMSIARMNVAVILGLDQEEKIMFSRIAAGSVMPIPARFREVENLLLHETPSERLFATAGEKVAREMIRVTGRRWSTEYKKPVIQVLVRRALMQAWNEARGNGIRSNVTQ